MSPSSVDHPCGYHATVNATRVPSGDGTTSRTNVPSIDNTSGNGTLVPLGSNNRRISPPPLNGRRSYTRSYRTAGSGSVTVTATDDDCPSIVAVIVAYPGDTACTSPEGDTVATAGESVDHCTARPSNTLPAASNATAVN